MQPAVALSRPLKSMNVGQCQYRGDDTGRKVDCGCPNLREIIYECNLLGGDCADRVAYKSRNEHIKDCRKCDSFQEVGNG